MTHKRLPLAGYNHNVRYRDQLFHVQTEDLGLKNPCVFTSLFLGGVIISTARSDYSHIARTPGHERHLVKLMQAQHKRLVRKLLSGELDAEVDALEQFNAAIAAEDLGAHEPPEPPPPPPRPPRAPITGPTAPAAPGGPERQRKPFNEEINVATAAEHFAKGMELLRTGELDDACVQWKIAAELDPQNKAYQANLKLLALSVRKPDKRPRLSAKVNKAAKGKPLRPRRMSKISQYIRRLAARSDKQPTP